MPHAEGPTEHARLTDGASGDLHAERAAEESSECAGRVRVCGNERASGLCEGQRDLEMLL